MSKTTTQLPKLNIGRFDDPFKTNFRKTQRFVVKQHTDQETNSALEKINPMTIKTLNNWTSSIQGGLGLGTKGYNGTFDKFKGSKTLYNLPFPVRLPQWIKYDKNVLKFTAYFVEHIVESAYENYRIRKCNIFYYLEDDTMHIDEVREENSGIVQGYFVKRQRCPKDGEVNKNNYITWRDFNLQKEIFLFGKKFRICNCDDFTKIYFRKVGIPLNQPEEIPEVIFEPDKFKNVDFEQNKKNIAEIKEYIEVGLKGGHPNGGLKQFLENDRKVLNFDISWFDDKYDKEEKVYKLNYFLADGKVRIIKIKLIFLFFFNFRLKLEK